jgi:hypothetical protein
MLLPWRYRVAHTTERRTPSNLLNSSPFSQPKRHGNNIYLDFNQTLIMQSVEAIKTPPPLQPRRRALATWGLRERVAHTTERRTPSNLLNSSPFSQPKRHGNNIYLDMEESIGNMGVTRKPGP